MRMGLQFDRFRRRGSQNCHWIVPRNVRRVPSFVVALVRTGSKMDVPGVVIAYPYKNRTQPPPPR